MKVKVKLFATLREITGKKEFEIEMQEGATVEDLLKRLSEMFGPEFVDYVFEKGTRNVHSYLHILINGQTIHILQGVKTRLKENSVLAILPPVGGGSLKPSRLPNMSERHFLFEQ